MKLRLSFVVVCSVLLSCLSLTFADRGKSSTRDCFGQYLKSRGKLDFELSGSKQESLCNIQHSIRWIRDRFNAEATEDYPSEASCIMAEFDRYEMADYILLFGFYNVNVGVSPADNMLHVQRVEGEGNEVLNKIMSKCGVNLGVKYQEYYGFV